MLRKNLKTAIAGSGLIVKEIAQKSGVNKRTIDKWVGISATEPRVNDLYRVCKVLSTTMEWLVAGEAGTEFIKSMVRNHPATIQVPDRIRYIVGNLLLLDVQELIGIRASAEALAGNKKELQSEADANSHLAG
jgi:transcriptional regulator with XRE-family HTH domain